MPRIPCPEEHQILLKNLTQASDVSSLARRFATLQELGAASIDQLTSIPGIGPARSRAIRAAYELSACLKQETYARKLLDSPEAVADMLIEEAVTTKQERAYLVLLDSRKRMIRLDHIATGTLDALLIHPREVYAPAIEARSSSIILAHTHPSGDSTPSQSDIKVTRMLKKSGDVLGIPLLDHVIVGKPSSTSLTAYSSMSELGYLR